MTLLETMFRDFDRVFSRVNEDAFLSGSNYPPHDVYVEATSDPDMRKLIFEVALAGQNKDDIDVKIDGDTLIITNEKDHKVYDGKIDTQTTRQYFKQQLAKRKFKLQYTISPKHFNLDDVKAKYDNGILRLEFAGAENNNIKQITF